MSAPHLHLILNHIPILGTVFGFLILLIGLFKRSRDIKNTGLLLFVLAALVAIPVIMSGEESIEIVRELPGVTHDHIHQHEEVAEVSFIAMEVLGGLALLAMLLSLRAKGTPHWMIMLCFALSMPVIGSMAYTADLGGQIRHIEIRPDFGKELLSTPKTSKM